MKRFVLALLLVTTAPTALGDCTLSEADRAWITGALRTWATVRTEDLRVVETPLPRLVFFDSKCVFDGDRASSHSGMVKLPDGQEMPAQIASFASTYDGGKPFLVMALPELWRNVPRHKDDPKLLRLMTAVFVHEMTHTVQAGAFHERLSAIENEHAIENLTDDIVQERFSEREGYAAEYKKERDLLYAIANEPDAAKRRALAEEVARFAKERRARWFSGDDSYFAELEELFLGMEGVANWAAFRAVMLDGATRAEAIEAMNKGRRFWSQDEGLALFLALDALMPGEWQKRVFAEKPAGVWTLIGSTQSSAQSPR